MEFIYFYISYDLSILSSYLKVSPSCAIRRRRSPRQWPVGRLSRLIACLCSFFTSSVIPRRPPWPSSPSLPLSAAHNPQDTHQSPQLPSHGRAAATRPAPRPRRSKACRSLATRPSAEPRCSEGRGGSARALGGSRRTRVRACEIWRQYVAVCACARCRAYVRSVLLLTTPLPVLQFPARVIVPSRCENVVVPPTRAGALTILGPQHRTASPTQAQYHARRVINDSVPSRLSTSHARPRLYPASAPFNCNYQPPLLARLEGENDTSRCHAAPCWRQETISGAL